MKDIRELNVVDILIFPVDYIPLRQLITATNANAITSPFQFKETEIGEDQNGNVVSLIMKMGEFGFNGRVYPVDRLIIERRKITLKIHSDSEIAEKFYLSVCDILRKIDPSGKFDAKMFKIKTSQTSCVVDLDFHFMDLISKQFASFLSGEAVETLVSAINKKASLRILPKSLSFTIDFTVTDKPLLNDDIKIGPKMLTIEPRVMTNLDDRTFFTLSPTDSKTHISLLAELEKKFKQ